MSQSGEPFDPYYQWLGIPPEEQPPNHYRLLGIRLFEENSEVIQNASDRQMVHLRTFQNGPRATQSQKLLNEVATAKLCLLSPAKRAAYDAQLPAPQSTPTGPPPPVSVEPAPETPGHIVWGTPPGTLPVGAARRKSSSGRSRRRSWLFPLLLVMVAVSGTVAAWQLFERRSTRDGRFVLAWPEAERSESVLQIDGQSVDVERDAVQRTAAELAFELSPGPHRVQILWPGYQPIDESIGVLVGEPTRMTVAFSIKPGKPGKPGKRSPSPGRLVLRWPAAARAGASLEIDGRSIDLTQAAVTANPDAYEATLRPGKRVLRIVLASGKTWDRTVELVSDQRTELDVTNAPAPESARIVLQWPISEREGATLELDGTPHDLTSASVRSDDQQVVLDVTPGEHAVRIARPGFADFQTRVTGGPTESLVPVAWDPAAPDPAAPDPAAPDRPSADELQTLREKFQKTYEEFDEYRQWAAEKDPEKQQELLRFLLAKLDADSAKLPANSPQQWVAYDEIIRLALAGNEFVQARNMLTGTVGAALFSDAERQERDELIWNAALKSVRVDALVDYLRLCSSNGRLPSEQEQSLVVDRLSNAPEIAVDVSALVGRVQELQDLQALTREAATKAQVAIYVKAAQGELGTLERALDLSETILRAVPAVFESGRSDAAQQVNALVDAVNLVRRKVMKETGDEAARLRLAQLTEGIKQVRDWESQFGHVRASRQAISAGQASPADHKLIGFWLLQLGRCADALPFLRESGDEALVQLAAPLPETAKDFVTLADNVEQESKKSKYSRRQEESLRAYVRFLRQTALDKQDTSLPPAERDALQKKLGAAETERHESYNRRFPKDKWSNLTALVTTDELRERTEQTDGGQWTLLEDGSIATKGKSTVRLELPVILEGSYGVRFLSRRKSPADIHVHLPVGDTSVLFTLGSPARSSGLQLIDGKRLEDEANTSRIGRSELSVATGGPIAVEIQVDIERAESQNTKRRAQTEGKDWVTISLVLRGNKTPVARSVSAAVSAFAPPKDMDTPPGTLSLSAGTEAVFGGLQLTRR
ncbi:MAG: peptidase associated/transthyretin-like domain-containing protein [Pirellulaceae bacterium]